VVADFGLAKQITDDGDTTKERLTVSGATLGTPHYMSPEQAKADRDPDARSDVYSLGCMLYEMLVGEPPFPGASAQAVLAKILTEEAHRPSEQRKNIPANVDGAVARALEKLPADRFGSSREFVDALTDAGFRYGESARDGAASPTRGLRGWIRHPASWVAMVAIVALLAALSANRNDPQRDAPTPVVTRARLVDSAESGQAPRLRALSADGRHAAWFAGNGWHLINMTQLPEAALTRELGMCYVNLSVITDYDVGVPGEVEPVTHEEVLRRFNETLDTVKATVRLLIPRAEAAPRACSCAG
jgi:serine/threonine-protein kinase